jgi:hypothetical protein
MTYWLNLNRIFAPGMAVVHRDEEYESGGFSNHIARTFERRG